MMLRQKTFLQALLSALSPRSRFHSDAGYLRRVGYYHAELMRLARRQEASVEWPNLCEGARLEVIANHRRKQYVVLLPGYLDVDGVWITPLLKDVTGEFEPGGDCSSSQMEYTRMLGKKWGEIDK